MPEFGTLIGGFIHWLLHRCRTSLKDEIDGNLDATWGGTYDTENYILGIATVVIIIAIVIGIMF